MRFVADHNVEAPVTSALEDAGHEVVLVAEWDPELPDAEILDRAEQEDRLLVTNDKDFAELAFLQRKATVGILLIRMPKASSLVKAGRLVELIETQGEHLRGALTVVAEDLSRRRPFSVQA